MGIVFGNLTVEQFAQRVGTEFSDADIAVLESYRTDSANSTDPATFHIFDDPVIRIHIGAQALEATLPIWERANDAHPFNRPVDFFPLEVSR